MSPHNRPGTPDLVARLASDELLSALERDPASAALAEARRHEIIDEEVGAASRRGHDLLTLARQADRARGDAQEEHRARLAAEAALHVEQAKRQQAEKLVQALRSECEATAAEVTEASTGRTAAEKALAMAHARCQALEAASSQTEKDWAQLKSHLEDSLSQRTAEVQSLQADLVKARNEHDVVFSDAKREEARLRERTLELEDHVRRETDQNTAAVASLEVSGIKIAKLEKANAELRRQRRALQEDLREVEELLAESERERHQVAQKYLSLGEKMEVLLAEEEATRTAADREISVLDKVAGERHQLLHKAKQWRREAKRLERRVSELEADLKQVGEENTQRGEALHHADRALVQLRDASQSRTRELEHQVMVLKSQVSDLETIVRRADGRADHLRASIQNDFGQRLELELKEQRLKYERRIAEVELEARRAMQDESKTAFKQWVDSRVKHSSTTEASSGSNPPSMVLDEDSVQWRRRLTQAVDDARAEEGATWRRKLDAATEGVRLDLQNEMDRLANRLRDAERRLDEETRAHQRALEAHAATAKLESESQRATHKRVHEEHAEAIEELRSQLIDAKVQVDKHSNRAATAQARIKELEDLVRTREAKVDAARRDVMALKDTVKKQQESLSGVTNRAKELEADHDRVQKSLTSTESTLAATEKMQREQIAEHAKSVAAWEHEKSQTKQQHEKATRELAQVWSQHVQGLVESVDLRLSEAVEVVGEATQMVVEGSVEHVGHLEQLTMAIHRVGGPDVALATEIPGSETRESALRMRRFSSHALTHLDDILRALRASVAATYNAAPTTTSGSTATPAATPRASGTPSRPPTHRSLFPGGVVPAGGSSSVHLTPGGGGGGGGGGSLGRFGASSPGSGRAGYGARTAGSTWAVDDDADREVLRDLSAHNPRPATTTTTTTALGLPGHHHHQASTSNVWSIRVAAEEIQRERDVARQEVASLKDELSQEQSRMRETLETLESAKKMMAMSTEEIERTRRAAESDRTTYQNRLAVLKERVREIHAQAKADKADAELDMQRLQSEWLQRMEALRHKLKESVGAMAAEREVAVIKARQQGEEKARHEAESRFDAQVRTMKLTREPEPEYRITEPYPHIAIILIR